MNEHDLRIGDAERDAAVSALGEHYAAGRLTKEEYDERSERAWTAKTSRDLWPLFVDLPSLNPAPQRPAPSAPRRSLHPTTRGQVPAGRRGWDIPIFPLLLVLVVVLGMVHVHWFVWVLVAWLWFAGFFRSVRRRVHAVTSRPAARPWGR
jgi:hypothetical protein